MRLGDLLIWCEAGPQAYLAAVIRGTPPETLRDTLRDALDTIHDELRSELQDYDGDGASLGDLSARLEPCLRQQAQRPGSRYKPLLWLIPVAFLAARGYWQFERYLERTHIQDYVDRLRAEPGIVLTAAERRKGVWHIEGLRDPLAADPLELRQTADLGEIVIIEAWEPYAALSPGILLKRLQASLPPLASVEMRLDDGVIRVEGGVPLNWVEKAQALVASLPAGAPTVDLSGLTDVVDAEYVSLRESIEEAVVYFELNAPDPAPGQEEVLDKLAADMQAIRAVASSLGFDIRLSIEGRADSSGRQTTNLAISIARAEVVRSLLRSRGIPPGLMTVRGTGTLEPLSAGATPDDLSQNRSVSFTITTSE
jgi:OOP family OmpA-OmpF porin